MERIDPIIRDIYTDLEPRLLPLIKSKARMLARHIDIDDLIQEGRMVVLRILADYDYKRCEDLERYVSTCLTNAYRALYAKHTAKCRMPRVSYPNGRGGYDNVALPPVALDPPRPADGSPSSAIDPADEGLDPESMIKETESARVCSDVIQTMLAELQGRELEVFLQIVEPVVFGGERVTCIEIMQALNINKNEVDWPLLRIRRRFLELCRSTFKESFGNMVSGDGWPDVEVLPGDNPIALKDRLEAMQLDAEPSALGQSEVAGPLKRKGPGQTFHMVTYARRIDSYSWGSVMRCSRLECAEAGGAVEEVYTVILRGRFNALFGEVHGRRLGALLVPVPWYSAMAKKLNDQRRRDEPEAMAAE